MEPNKTPDHNSRTEAIYRAVGWVAGTYQPSEENVFQGTFVTLDGLSIPAKFTGRLRGNLSKKRIDIVSHPDLLEEPQRWTVYPKTEPLRFDLVMMKPLNAERVNTPPLDEFRIVGEIISNNDETITIRIGRNLPNLKGDKVKKHSFVLTLKGSLPDDSVRQVWALEVTRQEENLVVVAAQPYTPSEEDLVFLERNAKKMAAVEEEKNSTSEPTIEDKARSLTLNQQELANPTRASNPQETLVETEREPQSNVEPQKPKNVVSESSQQTADTTDDKQQQSNLTEKQPHSTSSATDAAKSLSSQSKFFVESTPNPKAFARPGRSPQQKSRDASNSAKNRSPADAQTLSTSTQQQQQLPPKKQPNIPSATRIESKKSKTPTFQVKVNDRVYNGYNSVTLTNRMVCIDGKPVAQAKMAVVLGQPLKMLADGKVTQGNNQAVLTSR